ncbi:MAG: AAA family ATPase [Oligoflexia bacterium]|nr:AAA family ATPase [Oligoflexia bacterium]
MYITEIRIENLRSFEGSHGLSLKHDDGSYAGWTVFAGRNGAGKSTLLKALALSVIGPLASRSLAGVFTDWVRTGSETATIATKVSIEQGWDHFQEGGRTLRRPFWVGLSWKVSAGGTDELSAHIERRKTAERGPWADLPRGWFIAGYGPYRHLGPLTTEQVRLSANPVLARLVNLFNESATLSDAIEWLCKEVHPRALENRPRAAQLRDDVMALLHDGLLPDGSTVEKVDSEGLWVRRDQVLLPLEQVSDGYRTVAALVVDILRRLYDAFGDLGLEKDSDGTVVCNVPGVILIDEIDAHMHVAWQQRIGFWLTRRFPRIQFLVTTHSPFICQAASPGGLIRLPAPDETRRMEPVKKETWRVIVRGGADDAVLTELFGLDHAHSAEAEGLRQEVVKLEAKVIRADATPKELERYEKLKTLLTADLGELADRKLRAVMGGSR